MSTDRFADIPEPEGAPLPIPQTGWRILGMGAHPNLVPIVQNGLRSAGVRATVIWLTDDDEGDQRLRAALGQDTFDGVAIGGFVNGQHPDAPATEERALWFNRILNIIHEAAPTARIILVRSPEDGLPAIERVLGPPPK